jgi:N-acetyl sugar amidotransferase
MSRRCSRCVYDDTVPAITFDDRGVCNYCAIHDSLDREYPTGVEGRRRLEALAAEIKRDGRGKRYDVIVGVSGGCDSSYLVHLARELGLRPLAAHFDNTWNGTTAVSNIHAVLKALDVDLYTYVVDNEEYDDIYASFMRAGVPDVDAPTDLALAAVLYKAAEEHGIRHIFEGHSFRTEGVAPLGWIYMDGRYVRSVHRAYGRVPMRTYPELTLSGMLWWMGLKGIKKHRPLYLIDYRKQDAMQLLSGYGWQWYGGHHLENLFTAFWHAYFLPQRYGIDQRLLGHAALVRSGQLSRDEALERLAVPPSFEQSRLDMVKKRLGFDDAEFDRVMSLPHRTYRDFPNYKRTFERLRPLFWALYKLGRVPKSFYMKFTVPDPIFAGQRVTWRSKPKPVLAPEPTAAGEK